MKIVGVICEYNPFHKGHMKQFDIIRRTHGQDTAIVCLMSGNYVQRGTPAVFDKMTRAEAALRCGADLVLELPVTAALSSAEGFAAVGVQILSTVCDELCFGAETADKELLLRTAEILLSEEFPDALHKQLDTGLSFPAARQAALANMGASCDILTTPNNILGVEYCKAILRQNSSMQPVPICRQGDYHSTDLDFDNPSATSLRQIIENGGKDWLSYIPDPIRSLLSEATVHTFALGERAVLARLRCMTDAEFEALPYGSEGLWRKLMHAARSEANVSDIITATKSKRYTYSRIARMILCGFLGITEELQNKDVPYVRILAFNDSGREILRSKKQNGFFVNIGEKQNHDYQILEQRCSDLYGLFAADPEKANAESGYRVSYFKEGLC